MNEEKPLVSPNVAVDLSNCDREPIHIPSLNQPHGVVLAARMLDMRIVYTSENSMDVLGLEPAFILRSTLQQVLGEEVVNSIVQALGLEERLLIDIMISVLPACTEARFDISAHRTGNLLCVELQLASEERRWNLLSIRLTKTINHLGQPKTLEALFESIPPLIRNLTGYDRVMVYRFDVDGHGEVIAEARDPAMEPFLGLHYPATDIPAQARELYKLQRIRTIVDVGYKPVRILANPELAPDAPFDMTYCGLRSVSPIHIEYLQNMGVAASMGLSLIHEGQLWGLVLCHHRTPRRPLPETVALCSLLGQHISLLIGITLQVSDRTERIEKALMVDVMSAAIEGGSLAEDLLTSIAKDANDASTLALMRADGALIRLNGQVRLIGATPDLPDALSLMSALHSSLVEGIVSTRELGALLPEFGHLAAAASGILMITFDDLGDGILWFRREITQTVRWAGKPDATKEYHEGSFRLSPRKSFAAWEVVQRGRSLPWHPSEIEAARKLQIGIARSLLRRSAEMVAEAGVQLGAINQSQMVIELNMDGTILRVNDNVLRRFGYTAADLEGKDHGILLPKEDRGSERQKEFWDALRLGKFQSGEFKRIGSDGREVWVEVRYNPIFGRAGLPLKILAFATDETERVTNRLANEGIIRDGEARLKAIVDNVLAGIIMIDQAGIIASINAAGLRMFGYQSEDVIGQNVNMLIPAPDRELNNAHLARYASTGQSNVIGAGRELEGLTKDGRLFPLELTVNEVSFGGGRMFVGMIRDITERRQVELERRRQEEALRKSEAFLDRTGQIAGVGGWEIDLLTDGIFWSPETTRILGAPPDYQPTLDKALDLYTAESRPLIAAAIEKASSGAGGWDLELSLAGVDGRLIWARVVGTAEFAEGKPVRLSGAFQDMTARVVERQELERTRERLGLAVESGAMGIWEFDIASQQLIWDSQMYQLYGKRGELGGGEPYQFWLGHLHPEDRDAVEHAFRDGIEGVRPYDTEFRIYWDDGSLHSIKATGKAIRDRNGKALRVVGTNFDITERKQAEEERRLNNENMEMLFRSVKDYANLMLDLDGRVMTWNKSAENIKGYRAEDILGTHFSRFYTLEDLAIGKPAQELLTAVKVGHCEDTGWRVRKDGSRFWAHVVITPLFDAQGKQRGYGKVTRDITALKVAEDALLHAGVVEREATQKAEDANHAKSDFLANMSHEIRTPMNAIMGMTYLALNANPVPEQRVFLTKISNAAESLLGIINDILDISKMEANKMEVENTPFLLQDVLDNARDMTLQIAREKGIALIFPYAPETPHYLQGDPLRLGQVLINLVNNAVKFTQSGEVIVKVAAEVAAGDTMRIKFSVSDTGIGMDAAQISKLFQSFKQADASTTRKYGGTGLGLAISKQLCELMGASLQVESKLGKGSTFFFAVIFNKATAVRALTNRLMRDGLKNKSVLVVDDSEHARDVMVAMLRANGFVTKVAISGEEALSLLVESSVAGNPFDLVLLDWRMPGMSGTEASHQIKTHLTLSHIPAVLMISAFEREEVMERGAMVDTDRLLIKPVTEALLIDSIAEIFGVEGSGKEAPPMAPANQTGTLTGRRVLLVEDNEINVDLASALLERLGIVVTVALNGREGVDRVVAEPFDLVLMDIQMPVMDGLSATRLIRGNSRYRDLPIIAMTAHAMSGDRERSLSAGMNDHLTKPINPKLLTKFLLRYMPPRLPGPPTPDKALKNPDLSLGGLPDQLPPFDIQAALERTGDSALLRKMLLKFYGQYRDAGVRLREHLAAGQREDAVRLVHSLKSIAATLEARDLAAAAYAMEPALRTGQTAELGPLIETMEKALGIAVAAAAVLDRRSSAPKAASPVSGTPRKRPRILVVDDDSMNIDLFAGIFSGDYEVLSATDGTKALEIARRESPELVLLDVKMPGIDGYEVCRRLLADPRTSAIPVIFVTSSDDIDSEAKGVGLGAVDYITKPINTAKVKARVDNQIKLKWEREKTAQIRADENRLKMDDEIKRGAAIDQLNKQELQLKDDFLSHVSHELRSPLTAIYSFTTIIADGLAGPTNEDQNEYLAIILKNVRQLQAMVEDLLQVTQSATGKLTIDLQSVPVRGVVLDALHTMQGAAGAKIISLSYDLADDLASAYVDRTRFQQILIILLDNAIKFTPVYGEIKVRAGIFSKDPGFLLFEVSDTGCGIGPEKVHSIFEHLYQITDTGQAGRKGLGLGLHIAKDLVTRQGGVIWVNSTPPNGSQFFFTLPMYRGQGEENVEIGLSMVRDTNLDEIF